MTDATDRRRPLAWQGSSKKGLGPGVFELVEDYCGDTFRTAYTVKVRDCVHVLHAFKKKSKSGIGTPREDAWLIQNRLKVLLARHRLAGR